MKRLPLICAAMAVCIFGDSWQLRSQTTAAATATATVRYSNGNAITFSDFSNQIGMQPREFVNITVQFTPAPVGQPVIIEPLDGGATSFGASIPVIDSNGSISFGFLAPAKTGMKTVSVRVGPTRFLLRFSVLKATSS